MTKRIFVAGHNGMVGAAIVRQLKSDSAVADFFATQNINEVYLCAAKVGGIHANDTYPADFIYEI